MVDNRASGGGVVERATFTCSHCQRVQAVDPTKHGYCRQCDHFICDSVRCNSECLSARRFFDTLREKLSREALRQEIKAHG